MYLDCRPIDTDSDAASLPAQTFADIDEKDVQTDRMADVPAILKPEETENTPNSVPTTKTDELPVTAVFAKRELRGDGAAKERTCEM